MNGAGTVSAMTITTNGRGYTPSEPIYRPAYYWLQAPFDNTLVKMGEGNVTGVHPPAVTQTELMAFLVACYYSTTLSAYVDDFFGVTLTDSRLEGIANLTFLVSYGAQWGLQFNDPWAFGPYRGADWASPNLTMQAINTLNATP